MSSSTRPYANNVCLVWNLLLISVTFLLIPLFLLTFLSPCHFLFKYQLRYLSHLLRCIFYLSDDVTCSNETLSINYLVKAKSAEQLCFSPEFDFRLVPSLPRFRHFKLVLWHRRPRRRSIFLLLIEQEIPAFEWNSPTIDSLCHCEDALDNRLIVDAESLTFNKLPIFIKYPEVSEWKHAYGLIVYWAKVLAIRAMLKWQLQ